LEAKTEAVFLSVAAGRGIPRNVASVEVLLALALKRKDALAFSHARRLLSIAWGLLAGYPHRRRTKVIEQLALCTYKDPDLPADERFDAAFAILRVFARPGTDDDFSATADPSETYGIAGAIFKGKVERRWGPPKSSNARWPITRKAT